MRDGSGSSFYAELTRFADLPATIPLEEVDYAQKLPSFELPITGWESGNRPPVFHAYTQQITKDRRFFIHVSSVDGELPFLWLSYNQYKTCRHGHSHFQRLVLLPLVEGLGGRWHTLTCLVSYDFSHVLVTASNTMDVLDPITWLQPGQMKTRRFNLTASGACPVIASPLGRRAKFMQFL